MQRRKGRGAAGLLATLCLVASLGELRPAATAVAPEPRESVQPRQDPSSGSEWLNVAVDADGPSDSVGDTQDDAVHVAPAVFAPNPNIRFVYNTHISKWM